MPFGLSLKIFFIVFHPLAPLSILLQTYFSNLFFYSLFIVPLLLRLKLLYPFFLPDLFLYSYS